MRHRNILRKVSHAKFPLMAELDDTIRKNNLFFRQLLFLSVLILMGVVMLRELSFIIGSFLGAITLYIVFRPLQYRLIDRYRWRPWLASLLLVFLALLVLAGLLFGVFRVVSAEIINIDFKSLLSGLDNVVEKINRELPFNLIPASYLSDSSAYLTKAAGSIINTTYSFVINILFTIIILYFMLANARTKEVSDIIYSNAVGIPIIMLGQGLTAALIYWLFGIQHIAFWAFLTAIAGLIPVVGSIIVSVPLGISIIMQGHLWQGILLMLCGMLVIANVDNLIRIFLNKKMTDTHPLIVIFGVFMGIPLFGFWGIIFGPLLISIFLLLIKIYYHEFKLMTPQEIKEERMDELSAKSGQRRKGLRFGKRRK